MAKISGVQRQILKIVKLSGADEREIASRMAISINYAKDLCSSLVQGGFLTKANGKHKLTSQAVKLVGGSGLMRGSKLNVTGRYSGNRYSRTSLKGKEEVEKKQPDEHRYDEGQIIGEIKMKRDLPPREKVETALKANPHFSYEQMEAQMISSALFCPAKGKEVTWHYCSHCPHQEKIDLQQWIVQCKYEFTERILDLVFEEEETTQVACPVLDKSVAVDRCAGCRYWRGGRWQEHQSKKRKGVVGWLLCGAPSHIESRRKDAHEVVYGGKEMLMVPLKWE